MSKPFLHRHRRFKNGKEHSHWSIGKKVRTGRCRWVQRDILYLGEINASQRAAWTKEIEVIDTEAQTTRQLVLYPEDAAVAAHAVDQAIGVRLSGFTLGRPPAMGRVPGVTLRFKWWRFLRDGGGLVRWG